MSVDFYQRNSHIHNITCGHFLAPKVGEEFRLTLLIHALARTNLQAVCHGIRAHSCAGKLGLTEIDQLTYKLCFCFSVITRERVVFMDLHLSHILLSVYCTENTEFRNCLHCFVSKLLSF